MVKYIIELDVYILLMEMTIDMGKCIYILEGDQAVTSRMKIPENGCCRSETIREVQKVMEKESPYAAAYRHMSRANKTVWRTS